MPWIGAKYRFASTFSYRIPNFSSSYALSAPVPSPSTVKLAVTSEIIARNGNVNKGKEIFNEISGSKVVIELPSRIAIFKAFIKRLKQKRKIKGERGGFDQTFGIREYVHFGGPLGIYLEIPERIKDTVEASLRNISYFGTSDSICSCIEVVSKPPSENCVVKEFDPDLNKNGIVFLLSDFTETVSFNNVNPYSEEKMTNKHISIKPYFFPLKPIKKENNYILYETVINS